MLQQPEIALPDDLTKTQQSAVRCIRTYYVRMVTKIDLLYPGGKGTSVAKSYDNPDKGYCIWFDMYRHGQEYNYNPLWSLDLACRTSQRSVQELNIHSCMKTEFVTLYKEHGKRLQNETVASVIASKKHILSQIPSLSFLFNMTPESAITRIHNQDGIDPLIELLWRDFNKCEVGKALVVDARLSFARTPEVYKHESYPKTLMQKYKMVDLFGVEDGGFEPPTIDGLFGTV